MVLIAPYRSKSVLVLLGILIIGVPQLGLVRAAQEVRQVSLGKADITIADEDLIVTKQGDGRISARTPIYDAETSPNGNPADADGDGLLDFQEIHKYRTDPTKRDTDGDGIADSDWNERREYTYSVRSVLQFMPPFDGAALNDDFQDARVLEKRDDYIELEVVHYPFATAAKSIESNLHWQQDYGGMTRYLKPGITTNWDAKMKQELLSELRADGIIIDKLADKEVVEQVSSWLMKKSKSLNNVFSTYYIYYPNDQPTVYPGLEGAFEGEFNRDKDNYDWTIDRHFDHELLGKGMFYNKTHGACTSFAVYLTTVLKAVGIPTRMIIVIPAVDPSDKAQVELVRERITHNRVREIMLAGLRRSGTGFTAHTFNEVYVGNRWHRLNCRKLGQPILDEGLFGLHTHLYTFNDLSEANLAATWGWRYGKGERSAVLKHNNPYTAVTLSDLFGCHSSIANPVITKTAEDQLPGSLPNIYVMAPAGLSFNAFEEVLAIVKDATLNKTGRDHAKQSYDEVFVKGIWGRKPGDIVVLLFSLDTEDRVPAGYEDLLAWEWSKIEQHLEEGRTLEVHCVARDLNVIFLAAPKRGQLQPLIRDSKWLGKFAGHDGKHRPDEPWAATGNVQGPVEYSITIPDEDWRRVEVKARFVTDGVLSLWMNNNGAPKVPDGHGAFVRNLTVVDSAGNAVPVEDFGRARWKIEPVEKQAVTLKYEVLLEHDTSDLPWGPDEAPYVTEDGVFWTGRALFIVADMSNITVRFKLPDDWHVSTPWKPVANGGAAYLLQDEENLTEAFVFAGTHLEQRAKAKDMQILVALGSEFKKSKEILQETSQSLLNACAGLFQGTVPGQTLIVVNHQDRKGRFDGGVFGRSVSMLMSDKPSQSNSGRWAPFMAHEVFHLWNGQFIKHSGQEQWLSEGFTDYYAIVASARTGLVDERQFVQRLERACESYCAKSGQKPIRRAREHALQYAGGSLVAVCLDVRIRQLTDNAKGLDDLMREMYKEFGTTGRKYSLEDVIEIASDIAGKDLTEFFEKYVEGTEELPLEQCLGAMGLDFDKSIEQELPDLAYVVHKMLRINSLMHTGLLIKRSQEAGYQDGDRLTAIAGTAVTNVRDLQTVAKRLLPGQKIEVSLLRNEKEITIELAVGGEGPQIPLERKVEVTIDKKPDLTDSQNAILSGIIGRTRQR